MTTDRFNSILTVTFLCAIPLSAAADKLTAANIASLYGDWCLVESIYDGSVTKQNMDIRFSGDGKYRLVMPGARLSGEFTLDADGTLRVGPYYFSDIALQGDSMTAKFAGDSRFSRGNCPAVADASLWTEFLVAIREGNVNVVKVALAKGFGVDDAAPDDVYANAPLHIAAKYGKTNVVDLLQKSGADINRRNAVLATPLLIAAEQSHIETMSALLKGGADPNIGDSNQRTPLYWSIGGNSAEGVRLLLEHGADPNIAATNGRGETTRPLQYAAAQQNGDARIIELLKSHGAK